MWKSRSKLDGFHEKVRSFWRTSQRALQDGLNVSTELLADHTEGRNAPYHKFSRCMSPLDDPDAAAQLHHLSS